MASAALATKQRELSNMIVRESIEMLDTPVYGYEEVYVQQVSNAVDNSKQAQKWRAEKLTLLANALGSKVR